jgi:hypothetical protein
MAPSYCDSAVISISFVAMWPDRPPERSCQRNPVRGIASLDQSSCQLYDEAPMMSRFDLAHVDPRETGFDALGKGVEEGKQAETPHASKYMSKGLTRSRTDKLVVMPGGADARATGTF